MRLHLCGVRGSSPAPGAAYTRIGGHTSCVAIAHDDDPFPHLILDGGTGLRNVSVLFGDRPFQGSILLGHLHWDHTQGLPFFEAGVLSGARVDVVLPAQGSDAGALLTRMMGPPFFPIEPHELGDGWTFTSIGEGTHELEGFTVLARDLPHPGGRTFGFRVSDGRSTMAYLSDHGPLALGPGPDGWGEYHEAALELVDGVDLLLHDSQFTAAELAQKPHFGHSAVPYAVSLAAQANAGKLLLFHHDPLRTDDEVDALVAAFAGSEVEVAAAVEGDVHLL